MEASVAGWHTPPALRVTPSILEGEFNCSPKIGEVPVRAEECVILRGGSVAGWHTPPALSCSPKLGERLRVGERSSGTTKCSRPNGSPKGKRSAAMLSRSD